MANNKKAMLLIPEYSESPLKKQSHYSGDPWKPGEIPARPFMGFSCPHDQKGTSYGHGVLAVECPTPRGKKYPVGGKIDE